MSRTLGVLIILLARASWSSSILVVAENDTAREVGGELVETFGKQKVKVKLAGPQAPATQCLIRAGGDRNRCLAQAGDTAFVDAVLLLGASSSKGRTSVVFLLLSLDDGKAIKREVATGPSGNLGNALKPVVARISKLVKPRAQAKPDVVKPDPTPTKPPDPIAKQEPAPVKPVEPEPTKVEPTDTPKTTKLVPDVIEPTPPLVVKEPQGASGLTVAAWTTTGLAVASAGVAGTFGALGLSAKSQLDANEGGVSSLTRSQANALAAQGNTDFAVALGAGIGAGVLGVVSAILWSQTP